MKGPYKKQKKHTPLSKEALTRFEKELPQRKRDWYTPRAHQPDAVQEEADGEEAEVASEESASSLRKRFESNDDAASAAVGGTEPPRARGAGRFRASGEVPERMKYSDGGAAAADAPSPPKMAELRAQALEDAKARHRTAEERRRASDYRVAHRDAVREKRRSNATAWESNAFTERRRRLPAVGLLELLGIGAIVSVGLILMLKFTEREKEEGDVFRTVREPAAEFSAMPDVTVEQVLQLFYKAATVEELLLLVRHPERNEAAMRDWYSEHPLEPISAIEVISVTEGMVSDGAINAPDQLWMVVATVQHSKTAVRDTVMLERTAGGFKVDWETAARVSEKALGELVRQRSPFPASFRVTLTPDDYYNYQFSDRERWACYRLGSETGEHRLFGYIARGSAVEAKLADWFYPGETSIPVIATLRFPPEAAEEAVEITDLVQKNWIKR